MPGDMIPKEVLESRIILIRGRKVMLDRDLAAPAGKVRRIGFGPG